MIDVKETIKRDGKLKGVHIINDKLIDGDGEVVDIVDILSRIYGEQPFDLSVTSKTEEVIELSEEE